MIEKEIKYIGFYNIENAKVKRVCSLAATNKMDYICDSLNKAGYKVHIVSPSWLSDDVNRVKFIETSTIQLSDTKKVTLAPSFSTSKKITGYFKVFFSLCWLFYWLLINVNKNEKILVYHAPWLSLPVLCAKKIKAFHLILEVEEIYHKVWNTNTLHKKFEDELIKNSDSYIVVSDILYNLLPNKEKIILYGSYNLPKLNIKKITNHKINIVYAGTIEKIKGGAFNVVKCIKYLTNNYTIYILGYGNMKQTLELKKLIKSENTLVGRKACLYLGVKTGKDYSSVLSKCQIGVNPQQQGDYMETAFPSKIISYLAHNLSVVSTRISSIEKSKIREYITFTIDDSPEEIANAIQSIEVMESHDYSNIILKLDDEFVTNISKLLKK